MSQMDRLPETAAIHFRIGYQQYGGNDSEDRQQHSGNSGGKTAEHSRHQGNARKGLQQGHEHSHGSGQEVHKLQPEETEILRNNQFGPDGVHQFQHSGNKENQAGHGGGYAPESVVDVCHLNMAII